MTRGWCRNRLTGTGTKEKIYQKRSSFNGTPAVETEVKAEKKKSADLSPK